MQRNLKRIAELIILWLAVSLAGATALSAQESDHAAARAIADLGGAAGPPIVPP